jgi:hypothetical protein
MVGKMCFQKQTNKQTNTTLLTSAMEQFWTWNLINVGHPVIDLPDPGSLEMWAGAESPQPPLIGFHNCVSPSFIQILGTHETVYGMPKLCASS